MTVERTDQIKYYDKGPYRVHLRKRREYVEGVLKDIIGSRDPKALVVFDLGCGDGANLRWLKDFGFNLWGVDNDPVRIERNRESHYAHVIYADIEKGLRAHEKAVDIVFCNHVLEHIENDLHALKNIHAVLKNGGHLVLGAPNEGCDWWQLAYKITPGTLKNTEHVHFYTAPQLIDMCKEVGFEIKELKYIGYGLPHWRADEVFRNIEGIDDLMEQIGSHFFPDQASSLYITARKP